MILDGRTGSFRNAVGASLHKRANLELTTNSGFALKVGTADEADSALLEDFFDHVSEDDLRFRFLSSMQEVGPAQLSFMTKVDHIHSENFLAFHPIVGFLLASAMLAIDDDFEQAEVAIVIRSDFKNRGIGWSLLNHVSERAAAMGVKTLRTIESRDNRSAIRLEREMGFVSRPTVDDTSLVILEKSLGPPERGLAA